MGEVNRQLTAFLRRRQALRRTWQTRSALCSQYARLDKFMRSAATELSTGLTPDLPRQEKLDGFLRSMNLSGGVVYYDKEGRLRVEVPAAEELKTRSARRELAEILGTPLREGEEENNRILFAQAEPFRATAALAGAPDGGAGERRHRHLVPAGGRDAVSPPLRRHGVRPGGEAGERPGGQAD